MVRKAHQESWDKFFSEIEKDIHVRQVLACKVMRHLNCELQDTVRLNVVKEKQRIEHYKNLWCDPGEENALQEDHTEKTVDEISMEELESAIQGLKMKNATGLDDTNLEHFKYGGITLKLRLLHLLNLSWKYCIIPSARQKAKIISLFKKGKRNRCENYRGISLLATSYKIYARILNRRQVNISDILLLEGHNSFRKGRSCTEDIFTI
jgi:hypothetical protein